MTIRPDIKRAIAKRIAAGESRTQACEAEGVSVSASYRWTQEGNDGGEFERMLEEEQRRAADMRGHAAAAHGLDPRLADRLRGGTAEELQADAAALRVAGDEMAQPPDLFAGVRGRDLGAGTDMNLAIRKAAGRA